MIQPSQSLVKYDNPVLVSRTDSKSTKPGPPGAAPGDKNAAKTSAPNVSKKLPPVDDKGRAKTPNQTEDILNSILPPREWEENSQMWIQKVSSTPATRLDVINLQVCSYTYAFLGTIGPYASKETSKRNRNLPRKT